jgi:geranylgeranylglycerol-phosphate geranylgeranyltransferase
VIESPLRRAEAWLRITRPVVTSRVGVTTAASALLAGAPPLAVLLAGAAGAGVAAGIYTLDDLVDVGGDQVNHPGRPLPGGELLPATVAAAGLALVGLGVGAAWAAHPTCGLFTLAFGVCAVLEQRYNLLQSLWLTRGLSLTLLVMGAMLLGALASGGVPLRIWALAGTLAVPHFGGRVLSDLPDVLGDKAQGLRTLPVISPDRSVRLVVWMLRLSAVTLPLPALAGFGWVYLGGALAISAFLLRFARALSSGGGRPLHALLNWVMSGIMLVAVLDHIVVRALG